MQLNTSSLRRIALLIKRYFIINSNVILIAGATILGVLLANTVLNTYLNNKIFLESNFVSKASVYFFITGLVITSGIFRELKAFNKGWFYLMLPANPREKFLVARLVSSVGYSLVTMLALFLFSLLFSLIATLMFTPTFYLFNPFAFDFLNVVKHYLILQSMFFHGAIAFRSYNFFKTVLSVLGIITLFFLISGLTMRLVYGSWEFAVTEQLFTNKSFFVNLINQISKALYYFIFEPFLLTVSYFKFREKEI